MAYADELKIRTKKFALRIMRLCRALPKDDEGRIIARQLLRSGTSIGANYRAACRARSKADFISKIGIVLEEADETVYWLELVMEERLLSEPALRAIHKEATEIVAIMVASLKTARTSNSAI